VVAGLALGAFTQPGPALLTGVVAGASVPFVTYIVDHWLRLDDATGVIVTCGLPALLGLLGLGIFADGAAGAGWQLLGSANYLGVAGQGVSGLLVARGFQPDFPGQFQAQVIGIVALVVWGFVSGLAVCAPLGLLFHNLQRSEQVVAAPGVHAPVAPLIEPDLATPEGAQPSRSFR
jgi:Amt family ammonium transporter